jgi:hypothetical protein
MSELIRTALELVRAIPNPTKVTIAREELLALALQLFTGPIPQIPLSKTARQACRTMRKLCCTWQRIDNVMIFYHIHADF